MTCLNFFWRCGIVFVPFSCWLSTEKGTIWAFVAPMILIIMVCGSVLKIQCLHVKYNVLLLHIAQQGTNYTPHPNTKPVPWCKFIYTYTGSPTPCSEFLPTIHPQNMCSAGTNIALCFPYLFVSLSALITCMHQITSLHYYATKPWAQWKQLKVCRLSRPRHVKLA